jgi:hypothetical protein
VSLAQNLNCDLLVTSGLIMGYLGYVYVESKSFKVRSDVRGDVHLEERSKGRIEDCETSVLSLKSTFLRFLLDWVLIFLPSFSLNLLDLF